MINLASLGCFLVALISGGFIFQRRRLYQNDERGQMILLKAGATVNWATVIIYAIWLVRRFFWGDFYLASGWLNVLILGSLSFYLLVQALAVAAYEQYY
ncbi:hypothetical protein [Loigolactobacillus binensis]|uniref:DUF2178 domain-containing protein n=1 Tax=Loigolactobacillus binensis TaxID=2559922 RepID=A0ABW3ECF1_9LACO|nr:hypothetical protein [Loigolactobacillus binensis]